MQEESILSLCRCGCGTPVKPGRYFLGGSHLRKRFTDEERFWLYVDKDDRPDACWLWGGGRKQRVSSGHRYDYGAIFFRGRNRLGHQVAYELASDEQIPDGFDVCHTCDTPACVRNDAPGFHAVNGILIPTWGHLFLGSAQINICDAVQKGRWSSGIPLECVARGERHSRAKLTEGDIREIRRLRGNNWRRQPLSERWTLQRLADRYGVANHTIHAICSGKIWAHVT